MLIAVYLFLGIFIDLFVSPFFLLVFKSPFLGAHLFTLIEFLLLSIYLFIHIYTEKKILLFGLGSFLFLSLFIYENFIITQKNFDSISTGISALIILIYSIYYLFHKINTPTGLINFDLSFLIIVSFIIYFSGTFFIYILSKNNLVDTNFQQSYILINTLILVLRNLIISFAFLQKIREQNLMQKENIKSK
jgi:hypothetical protein